MVRSPLRARLTMLAAAVLALPLVAVTSPAYADPVPDDTPVLLTPKGEHEDGSEDAESFDRLRDAYYWSRLLAGDEQLSIDQAAALRESATVKSKSIAQATTGKARGGNWQSVGPDPIVQVGRTTNTFEAVSGRIGALAVRNDGTIILGAAQGGIWTYDSVNRTWISRTEDADTQSIGALAIAPSDDRIVYAGTGEGALSGDSYFGDGVWRSTDGGESWRHVSSQFQGQATSSIVVDPTNANHLYLANLRGRGGSRRTTHPSQAFFGIWESRNGGSNWSLLKGTLDEIHGATDLVMDPRNPKVLWASFWGDGIYRSTDGGQSWTSALGNLPPGNFLEGGTRFALGLSHPAGDPRATVYTGYDYFDLADQHHDAQIWKTTDDGVHWAATPNGTGTDSVLNYCATQCFYDNVVRVDPNNANIVYALGIYGYNNSPQSGGIYRSVDGGSTWKNLGYDLHPDYHAMAFQPNDTRHVVIGNDGGAWQSFTGGGRNGAGEPLSAVDWENLNGQVNPTTGALVRSTGLRITQFTSMATVPQVPGQYWGGTQDNGTLRKSLANDRWFDQAGGDGGQVIVDQTTVNPLNPGLPAYVFGSFFGISPYRYNPSQVGTFFGNEAIDGGINMSDRAEFYVPWVQNRANPNQMFLGTYRLYRSNNVETPSAGDVHFDPISPDLSTGCTGPAPNGARGCFISAIGISEGGTGAYVGTDDGVLSVSPDAVTAAHPTWTRVGQGVLPNRPATQIAVDRSNWRIAYVSYAGFSAATPGNTGHVFKTTDGGTTWQDISGALPDVPVNSIVLDPSEPNMLYIGTDVGPFTTSNAGRNWLRLGSSMPKVATWQLDYDPSHATLAAGTHGRGAYTLDTSVVAPALVVSTSDSGAPVGPGSDVHYTITVRNKGNHEATGMSITTPVPNNTNFVSAGQGGELRNGRVRWQFLVVPAGGSISVDYTVKINPNLPATVTSITSDGVVVKSGQGPGTTGSPHVTAISPAHALTVSPAEETGGARVGTDASYKVHLDNRGFQPDTYALATASTWPAATFDASCTTPLSATPTVAPGGSTDVCVKVSVPASAANEATNDTTLTATSSADGAVHGSSTLHTIAVAVDTLLVDEDLNAPDVQSYYRDALAANGTAFSYWDLTTNPELPQSYLTAHRNVIWFTGNTYPAPITPYESELKALLDGGGRLFVSGQDVLDQAAGTTPFVRDYLHINWDGTERQNDKATATVTNVAGNPVSDGIGTVPIDHNVLGATFEDQVSPIAPAQAAFTDDTAQIDALSVAAGSYKVVFLAFPLEAYGNTAQKADLIHRTLAYFAG
ncbi:MAG: hypothetical protein ACJ72N_22500 [Labedaea sp.]